MSIDINDTRALRPPQMVRDALRNMGKIVPVSKIAVLGVSYRQDVGDTRYSGSEIIVRKLAEMGGEVVVHDPYVKHWWEFEKQDTYPAPGHSWKRFFRNQDDLVDLRVETDLADCPAGRGCGGAGGPAQRLPESGSGPGGRDDRPPGGRHRLFRHSQR